MIDARQVSATAAEVSQPENRDNTIVPRGCDRLSKTSTCELQITWAWALRLVIVVIVAGFTFEIGPVAVFITTEY